MAAGGSGGRPPPEAARSHRIALRALRGGARGGRRRAALNAGGYRRPHDLFKPMKEGIWVLRSDPHPPERSSGRRSGCRRLPEAAGGGPPEAGRVQCCEQKSPAGRRQASDTLAKR